MANSKINALKRAAAILPQLIKREIKYYRIQPTNLLLFLTYRCSSRCNSCAMWQRKIAQPELTLDKWMSLIDMAIDFKIKNVEMFGGDALLRKDVLLPLIRHARRKGIPEVDLATNCILMDENTAQSIIESGIGVIYASVDGIGNTYYQTRGIYAFEEVKRAIEFLVKARNGNASPKIIINCTISSLNVDSFEQMLLFAEETGVDALAFEYVGEFPIQSLKNSRVEGIEPQPYYIPQKASILLSREQAMLFKKKLKTLKSNSSKSKVRIITKNIDILKIDNLTGGRFPNEKCYVCRYMITVDPYGNIIPCPFYNNYHLGNIRSTRLSSIWKNEKHFAFIKSIEYGKIEICKYCILGVERNPTIFQELMQSYLAYKKIGLDEDE